MHEEMSLYDNLSDGWVKWHNAKTLEKKKLPLFIFMAGHIAKEKSGAVPVARRKAGNIKLNGMVMADFDDLEAPRKTWEELNQRSDLQQWFADNLLLAHVTPSGHGLRFVFKADVNVGNIADNQAAFAQRTGLPLDSACKDSSRCSYAVCKTNILFITDELFDYENPEFDEKYGESSK